MSSESKEATEEGATDPARHRNRSGQSPRPTRTYMQNIKSNHLVEQERRG